MDYEHITKTQNPVIIQDPHTNLPMAIPPTPHPPKKNMNEWMNGGNEWTNKWENKIIETTDWPKIWKNAEKRELGYDDASEIQSCSYFISW